MSSHVNRSRSMQIRIKLREKLDCIIFNSNTIRACSRRSKSTLILPEGRAETPIKISAENCVYSSRYETSRFLFVAKKLLLGKHKNWRYFINFCKSSAK